MRYEIHTFIAMFHPWCMALKRRADCIDGFLFVGLEDIAERAVCVSVTGSDELEESDGGNNGRDRRFCERPLDVTR